MPNYDRSSGGKRTIDLMYENLLKRRDAENKFRADSLMHQFKRSMALQDFKAKEDYKQQIKSRQMAQDQDRLRNQNEQVGSVDETAKSVEVPGSKLGMTPQGKVGTYQASPRNQSSYRIATIDKHEAAKKAENPNYVLPNWLQKVRANEQAKLNPKEEKTSNDAGKWLSYIKQMEKIRPSRRTPMDEAKLDHAKKMYDKAMFGEDQSEFKDIPAETPVTEPPKEEGWGQKFMNFFNPNKSGETQPMTQGIQQEQTPAVQPKSKYQIGQQVKHKGKQYTIKSIHPDGKMDLEEYVAPANIQEEIPADQDLEEEA